MLTRKLQDSPLDYLFFRLVEHELHVMMWKKVSMAWNRSQEEEKVGNQSFRKISLSRCVGMQFMMDEKPTERTRNAAADPNFTFTCLAHVCLSLWVSRNYLEIVKQNSFGSLIFLLFCNLNLPTQITEHPSKDSSELVTCYKNTFYQFIIKKKRVCP